MGWMGFRLHSADTRRMMQRYRIGVIAGRWKNFVPPIQGGVYRPLLAQLGAADSLGLDEGPMVVREDSPASSDSSDMSTTDPPSPTFDATNSLYSADELRRRHMANALPRSFSVSSLSSYDEPDGLFDGMAHLDLKTKEEITLDLEKYPALDAEVQDRIVDKYRQLNERIKAEGLYQCNYTAYAYEVARYITLFILSMACLRQGWYAASAVFLGCFWHQLTFTAHDAGHMGITHGFHTDTLIGIFIADFLGGLSIGWWKRNHNVHHIVTNSPEHDPDIEHMPFFAVSHRFLQSLRSTYYKRVMTYDAAAKALLSIQKYSYYPIMLFGRFNLYFLSLDHLLVGRAPRKGPAWWHRWLEIAGQVVFWTWFGYGILYRSLPTAQDRIVYLLVSHMITAPLHVQITLSHFAMSTADLGPDESFPQKMLRTTMDVDCPPWLDFFHGGLQFQAIHHLYPRIPRHNLRRTRLLIEEFCRDTGIPYALYGFVHGNKAVIGRLGEVSQQAAILAKCQASITQGGGNILHAHHG
jgi:delta8-fatty-acid desaturase